MGKMSIPVTKLLMKSKSPKNLLKPLANYKKC